MILRWIDDRTIIWINDCLACWRICATRSWQVNAPWSFIIQFIWHRSKYISISLFPLYVKWLVSVWNKTTIWTGCNNARRKLDDMDILTFYICSLFNIRVGGLTSVVQHNPAQWRTCCLNWLWSFRPPDETYNRGPSYLVLYVGEIKRHHPGGKGVTCAWTLILG